jgi:hypothetical protein
MRYIVRSDLDFFFPSVGAVYGGPLSWLAEERDDVLGIVATGHLSGVVEWEEGEWVENSPVRDPTYADIHTVRGYTLDFE